MLKNKIKLPKNQDEQTSQGTGKGDAGVLPEKVTNSTLHLHRKQVISKGKKLKYPFYHSKHKIVILSSIIGLGALVGLFVSSTIYLYKYKPTNDFSYALTKLIPYPIARVDSIPVRYSDYLFELKVTLHSLERSGTIDFNSPQGESMKKNFERTALNKAETFTYMRHVARENGITVTDDDVDKAVDEIKKKSLNVKSLDEEVDESIFYRTIKTEYNWSEDDLRKSIKDLLYVQKVKSILDTNTTERADKALRLLNTDKGSFEKIAKQQSDDKTSANRNGYVAMVTKDQVDSNDVPKIVINELFKLPAGEHSGIIKTDDALFIIKNNKIIDNKRKLSYIKFTYKDNLNYISYLRQQNKIIEYIKIQSVESKNQSTLLY